MTVLTTILRYLKIDYGNYSETRFQYEQKKILETGNPLQAPYLLHERRTLMWPWKLDKSDERVAENTRALIKFYLIYLLICSSSYNYYPMASWMTSGPASRDVHALSTDYRTTHAIVCGEWKQMMIKKQCINTFLFIKQMAVLYYRPPSVNSLFKSLVF